jgi:hypothetical protein
MAWQVEYLSARGAVVITAAGEVSNEDAKAQVVEALRFLEQNPAAVVLVDYAEALSEVSLPSLYALPNLLSRHGGLWNTPIAVVMPRSRYRLDSYQFLELVCRNAGYHVKLFNQREDAEEWLSQSQPGQRKQVLSTESGGACLSKVACT